MISSESHKTLNFSRYLVPATIFFTGTGETFTGKKLAYAGLAEALKGKTQGNDRKFLDRFKSYFGSQISSQSLNEIHICRLQPKSATLVDFFHMFLSSIVSSSRRMLPFDV